MTDIKSVADAVHMVYPGLTFIMLEIGARPFDGQREPFHELLDLFPGSQILAFELDEHLCAELNATAQTGIRYYPAALGRTEEQRLLYETMHPMCSSLYRPSGELLGRYNQLQVAQLKRVRTVETISIDHFMQLKDVRDPDFMKIDIQGAELDVFIGGSAALNQMVAIVSEVEFIPLYYKQPLFGDVCAFLTTQGLMFHKFMGMHGRTLQPIVVNNDPYYPTQHMWSDALFIKQIETLTELPSEKLLKLGLLAILYNSPDVTYYCFAIFDDRHGSSLCRTLLAP